jgi:hypothetical protein
MSNSHDHFSSNKDEYDNGFEPASRTPVRRPTTTSSLHNRFIAIEYLSGIVFIFILVSALVLVSIWLISYAFYRWGRQDFGLLCVQAAGSTIVTLCCLRAVALTGIGKAADQVLDVNDVIFHLEHVRNQSVFNRVFVSLFLLLVTAGVVLLIHFWTGLFDVRNETWVGLFFGAACTFVVSFAGSFASNYAALLAFSAMRLPRRHIGFIFRHRHFVDVVVGLVFVYFKFDGQ